MLCTSYEFDLPPPRSITKNYLHVDCMLLNKYFTDLKTLLARHNLHHLTSFQHTPDFDSFVNFSNPGKSAEFPGLDTNTFDLAFTILSNPSIGRKIYPLKSKSKSIKYIRKTTQAQILLGLTQAQQQQLTISVHRYYIFIHYDWLLNKQLFKFKFNEKLLQNRKSLHSRCCLKPRY